jgi:hypothetical protein
MDNPGPPCATRAWMHSIASAMPLAIIDSNMPDNSQQIARALEKLLQSSRGRLSFGWLVVLLVLATGYLLAEPSLETRLGVDLPGVHTPPLPAAQPDKPSRPGDPPSSQPAVSSEQRPNVELPDVFEAIGRDTYRTPAGLVYGRGSVDRTRLAHLLSHTEDDPNRPGQHGVFDETDPAALVLLVDEAYRQGLSGKNAERQREGNREVFTVDLGRRIGFIGGEVGNRRRRPCATHVRLVVEGDRFITAFPIRP